MTSTASPPPDHATLLDRYLRNLEALYQREPELAARVDALPFSALPAFEPTRDGGLTQRVRADDGAEIYLHSRYRALDEARRLLDAIPAEAHPTFLIHGLGLGYVLAELEQRYELPVMIVIEDDLAQLKSALCAVDLSAALREGRIFLLWSADRRALYAKLNTCNADILLGVQTLTLPHARRVHAGFYQQMQALLTDYLGFARTQMVTLIRNAQITFQNVANNLVHYIANPGVDGLRERAAGYPAIVVAAGPSLARNLDQVLKLRGHAVLIAVQTVLRLLHQLRCPPHFVTSLDFHEVSAEFFRGLDDAGDCVLVAEPKATWHVLDTYGGRKSVLHHPLAEVLLGEAAPPRAALRGGATVAHLAFYLADYLGCDPILFVGQDLSFAEGRFYLPGSPIERVWAPELNAFCTPEMKQWERIVRNRPILRSARDLHGRDVYTDDLLFSYAEQFQNDFAACRRRVIQASEGGLALRGMEVMSLSDAAAKFCMRPLPPDLLAPSDLRGETGSATAAAEALRARMAELEQVHGIATEMRGLLDRLTALVERPAEFNRLIVRVDELRLGMLKHDRLYKMIVEVTARAELRRYGADRRIGKPQKESATSAQQRLRRDIEFVDEFIRGCGFIRAALPQALERLEARSA